MRFNFYLRNPKKKGRTAIYLSVTYRGERIILFPGESIETANWINKKGINKPKPISENNGLIGRLMRFEQLVRDMYDELQRATNDIVPAEVLKNAIIDKISPVAKRPDNAPVFISDFFQTLIDDSRSKKRLCNNSKAIMEQSIQIYVTAQNHYKEFEYIQRKKYRLTDINQKLIDDFSDYLNMNLKMALNGSGKNMKVFKTMMNYARKKKLINHDIFMDSKVTVTKESPDNIYLSEDEIKDLLEIKKFETPLYETVRDYFAIGCKTGLRFSDYSILTKAKIDKGFINLTQQKTSGKVTIPVHPIVEQIFAKYPDGLPKCPPNQVFNRYLKEMGQQLPSLNKDFEKTITRSRKTESKTYKKWELLQTHTARRSFCTNEYLSGTPTMTIMKISGHKSEKSFMSYIKADSLQHAMLMRDRWKSQAK